MSELRRKTKHRLSQARQVLVAGLLGMGTVMTVFTSQAEAQGSKFYRPPTVAPPVHAVPSGNYRPAEHLRSRMQRQVQHTPRAAQRRYPVRHAGAYQQSDGSITDHYLNQVDQTMQNGTDQWRTRSDKANKEASAFLKSATERYHQTAPPTQQTPPPAEGGWQGNSISDVAMPDTEIPQNQSVPQNNYEIPAPQNPPSYQSDAQQRAPQNGYGQGQGQSRYSMPQEQSFDDAAPAMEDYANDPFSEQNEVAQQDMAPQLDDGRGQSVLVRDEPMFEEEQTPVVDNATSENSLRGMQVEPRRLRDSAGAGRGYGRNQFRNSSIPRKQLDEFDLDQEDDLLGNGPENQARVRKSCDEYREELLTPITDIVLDISPLRPKAAAQRTPAGLTRTWTDCRGTALATGTLIGMEQSYIVVNDETGQGRLIPMSQLSDGDLMVVTEFWGLPSECSLGCDPFLGRCWMPNTFFWKASALCHKPLYFESRALERYGHTHGPVVEPLHTSIHFFTCLLLWPYNTGIHPPNECLYALGFYRPGDCAPWLKEPIPLSLTGTVHQSLAIVAIGGIIP